MKILANFDRAIAENLADKVKSRLTFKVSKISGCLGAHNLPCPGSPRDLPLLRRRVDVHRQASQVQERCGSGIHNREGEDRQLQCKETR